MAEFVEEGGKVVAFDQAAELVIDACSLNLENLTDAEDRTVRCPGSTLRAEVEVEDELGYGMPREALVFNWNSPAFAIRETQRAENYRVIVKYREEDVLESGFLEGKEVIAGQPAMVSVKSGEGRAILIGFRPQHRSQTHGTFKLLFNCLYGTER